VTYIDWLLAGPYGSENFTVVFDYTVGTMAILGMLWAGYQMQKEH
jgi:hypothetical protein